MCALCCSTLPLPRAARRACRSTCAQEPWSHGADPQGSPGSPGARFRRLWPDSGDGGPGMVQYRYGNIGIRSFQRGAGSCPARHEHRPASAGKTALPGIPGILGGPAAPARLQGSRRERHRGARAPR
eukprot:gene11018-biopygen10877